jgi:alcohol dehydrogenase class IV
MGDNSFKASGYSWRLFCGAGVIESDLKAAVERAGAKRAFVICSPSINRKTNTVRRIAAALGDRLAGVFDEAEKDSTYASVCAAKAAAVGAGADLLIAVGGGSVIVAVRAVAIFMGESGDPFQLMSQYPEGGRPFSPRLSAPKLPIINIPTTPNSAVNRAGTGLKNPDIDHRMEYFDPKTRPQAIFFDDEVLLTTPLAILRSTATTVFAGVVGAVSHPESNPLVAGDQAQAFRLAHDAYVRLATEPDNARVRSDMALAAFLQNRAEDDGRNLVRSGAFSGDYAVSTALHIRYPHVGQGESTSVLQAPAIRLAQEIEPASAQRVAEALHVWRNGMSARQTCTGAFARSRYRQGRSRRHRRRDGEEFQRAGDAALRRRTHRRLAASARGRVVGEVACSPFITSESPSPSGSSGSAKSSALPTS